VIERLGLAGAEILDAERLLADAEQGTDLPGQVRALGRDRPIERVDRAGRQGRRRLCGFLALGGPRGLGGLYGRGRRRCGLGAA